MYVSGVCICDSYVWSPVSSQLLSVEIDYDFLSTVISEITNFYFNFCLNALVNDERDAANEKENQTNNKE